MFRKVSLFEVHGALASLVYAVKKTMEPLMVDVRAHWQNGIYLTITVECKAKHKQIVIDRLQHGVLCDGFDYRFGVGYPTMPEHPEDYVVVTGYPDIHHDHRRIEAKEAA